jgi:hypothetical protein
MVCSTTHIKMNQTLSYIHSTASSCCWCMPMAAAAAVGTNHLKPLATVLQLLWSKAAGCVVSLLQPAVLMLSTAAAAAAAGFIIKTAFYQSSGTSGM